MASDSLPHSDVNSNANPSNDLEIIHIKVGQSLAVLTILSDWLNVCPINPIPGDLRFKIIELLGLLSDMMEAVKVRLPEA